MTPYALSIELDILPRINSADNVNRWKRAKERDQIKAMIRGYTMQNKPRSPLKKARVRLTRFSSREPDCDNLAHSFKHVLDGLTFAGIIRDDRPSVIGSPEFVWATAPPRRGKIRIEVWG